VDDHGFVDNEVELQICGVEPIGVHGETISVGHNIPQVAHVTSGCIASVATPKRIEMASRCETSGIGEVENGVNVKAVAAR